MNDPNENPYAAAEVKEKVEVKKPQRVARLIALRLLGLAFILVFGRIVYGVFSQWNNARYIGDWLAVLVFLGISFFFVYALGGTESD